MSTLFGEDKYSSLDTLLEAMDLAPNPQQRSQIELAMHLLGEDLRYVEMYLLFMRSKINTDYFLKIGIQPRSYLVICPIREFLEMFSVAFFTWAHNMNKSNMWKSPRILLSDLVSTEMGRANENTEEKLGSQYSFEEVYVFPQNLTEKQEKFFHTQVLADRINSRAVRNMYTLVLSEVELDYVSAHCDIDVIRLDPTKLESLGLFKTRIIDPNEPKEQVKKAESNIVRTRDEEN